MREVTPADRDACRAIDLEDYTVGVSGSVCHIIGWLDRPKCTVKYQLKPAYFVGYFEGLWQITL